MSTTILLKIHGVTFGVILVVKRRFPWTLCDILDILKGLPVADFGQFLENKKGL